MSADGEAEKPQKQVQALKPPSTKGQKKSGAPVLALDSEREDRAGRRSSRRIARSTRSRLVRSQPRESCFESLSSFFHTTGCNLF